MASKKELGKGLPQLADSPLPAPEPISIFNRDEPRSIVNLVPPAIAKAFEEIQWEKPEYFEMDEQELYKALSKDNKRPTATDNRLRIKFWMEYEYAQTYYKKKIDMVRVVAGICPIDYFYNKYVKSPSRIAWMLTPPISYEMKTREALDFGLDQLRDLLEQSHELPGGRVDTKLAELKMKVVAMLDMRVKGAIVQKTMNLHATGKAAAQAVADSIVQPTMEQLEARRRSLREEQERLRVGGPDGRAKEPQET